MVNYSECESGRTKRRFEVTKESMSKHKFVKPPRTDDSGSEQQGARNVLHKENEFRNTAAFIGFFFTLALGSLIMIIIVVVLFAPLKNVVDWPGDSQTLDLVEREQKKVSAKTKRRIHPFNREALLVQVVISRVARVATL